jgi:hypothetical protein
MNSEHLFKLTNLPLSSRPEWNDPTHPDESVHHKISRIAPYLLSVGELVLRRNCLWLSIPTTRSLLGTLYDPLASGTKKYGTIIRQGRLDINLVSSPISYFLRGDKDTLVHTYMSLLSAPMGDNKELTPEDRLRNLHVVNELTRMLTLQGNITKASNEENRDLFLQECQKLCDSLKHRDSNSEFVLSNVKALMRSENLIPLKNFLYHFKIKPSNQLLKIISYCDINMRFCAPIHEFYLYDTHYSNFPSITEDTRIRRDTVLRKHLENNTVIRMSFHCEKTISTKVDGGRQLSFIRARIKAKDLGDLETVIRHLNVFPDAARYTKRGGKNGYWVEIFNHDALNLAYNLPKVKLTTKELTKEKRHRVLAQRLALRVFNRNKQDPKSWIKNVEVYHDIFGTEDEKDIFLETRNYIAFVCNILNAPKSIEQLLVKAEQDKDGRIRIPQLIPSQRSAVRNLFPKARAITCKQGVFWVNGRLSRNVAPLRDRRSQEQKDAGVPWDKEKDNPRRVVSNIAHRRQFKAFRDVYLETAEEINKFVSKKYCPNFFTVDHDLPEIASEEKPRLAGKKVYPPQKIRTVEEMLNKSMYSHNYYTDETKKKPVFFAVLDVNLAETKVIQQYFKELGCGFSNCQIAGSENANYGKNRGTRYNVIMRKRENLDKVLPNLPYHEIAAEKIEAHDYPRKPLVGFKSNTAKHLIRSIQHGKTRVPRTDRKFIQPKTFWRYKPVDLDGRLMYYYDAEGAGNLFSVESIKNPLLVEYLKQQTPQKPVKEYKCRN